MWLLNNTQTQKDTLGVCVRARASPPASGKGKERESERETERERAAPAVWQSCTPSKFDISSGYRKSCAPPRPWSLGNALVLYWLEFTCGQHSAVKVGHRSLQSVFCMRAWKDGQKDRERSNGLTCFKTDFGLLRMFIGHEICIQCV